MNVEAKIHLNKFKPRSFQLPLIRALEEKKYRKLLSVWPRRAGKDITAWNLMIRQAIDRIAVYYYIFPTFSQGRRVIWDSLTIDGMRFVDYIPKEFIDKMNDHEMKIRLKNGSLIQIIGSDNIDCYDDQTEILTDNGWKLFKDLNSIDLVGTLKEGFLEFEKPIAYVDYEYDGPMYSAVNGSLDFKVTPNHRFYVKSKKDVYKFKRIDDPTIRHDLIPVKSLWKGDDKAVFHFPFLVNSWVTGKGRRVIKQYNRSMPMELFVALLGIFLSEGSVYSDHKTYRVFISQVKEHRRKEIEDLLQKLSINYQTYVHGFSFEDRQMYEYFSQFGTQKFRFIPKDIKNLSTKYLSILFEWLLKGDGCVTKNGIYYYSISKQLMDDIQEIIIKLGYSSNISVKKQRDSCIRGRIVKSKNILYSLRLRTSDYKYLISSKKNYINVEWYRGKVYCVSVSSGIIKVRRNGKEYWSGNSIVGSNPYGCVFSEYALQDPKAYQFLRPILAANDGWALFISTPRGKNHLYEMYQIGINNPDQWFVSKLTLDDTQHVSLQEIERDKAEGLISEDLIQQEWFTSFDLGVEGSYYGKYLDRMRVNNRITQVPWENSFKVHTSFDLGMRDETCIIFYQTIGTSVRIIDTYSASGHGLDHYVKVLQQKPYSYGKHIAPHDIKVRELGTGMSRLEKARTLGLSFTVAPDLSIEDGIEAVRSLMSKLWIDSSCKDLIKALENYRHEYDAKRKIYKNTPLHDFSSHYSDCLRYLAISLPKTADGLTPEELDRRYSQAMQGPQSNMPRFFRDE